MVGAIIAGFDVHLPQITFHCLDSQSGEVTPGRMLRAVHFGTLVPLKSGIDVANERTK